MRLHSRSLYTSLQIRRVLLGKTAHRIYQSFPVGQAGGGERMRANLLTKRLRFLRTGSTRRWMSCFDASRGRTLYKLSDAVLQVISLYRLVEERVDRHISSSRSRPILLAS